MPTNGERLSAVARQRRLREARSAASTPSALSPPAASPPILSQPVSEEDAPEVNDRDGDSPTVETFNQFSTLVDASAVQFSSSREIDQVTENTVKIRLSRGQKCVVLGTCTLWVKQGSVFIYGAILHASTVIHRIYAPSTHALPSIEALSPKTEFQLESLDDGLQGLPYIGIRDLWSPPGVEPSVTTFHILGHNLEPDPKAPRRLKEMNLNPWRSLLSGLTSVKAPIPPALWAPRIMVCGRRSSGLSTLVRCIINRILTKQSASRDAADQQGVILVDLDTNMPEFAPPGMISLVHLVNPVFGPPFTHIFTSKEVSSRVLRVHFLGDLDSTELSDWHIDRVQDLLDLEKHCRADHPGAAVIMIMPKWLNEIEENLANKLWVKMSPTSIVCLDPSPASAHVRPWKSLAEIGQCLIHQLPVQAFDKISAARAHDLLMQSYFHLMDSSAVRPLWSDTPILAGNQQIVTLTYGGEEAAICAIILLGGHVALEDTYDALDGSVTAIVAVKNHTNRSLTLGHGGDRQDGLDCQHDSDKLDQAGVYRTEEDLPRWQGSPQRAFPMVAAQSFCSGLGIVVRIDIYNRRIDLIAGPGWHVPAVQKQGCRVVLVVPKATTDGRFKTDWTQREMRTGGREGP